MKFSKHYCTCFSSSRLLFTVRFQSSQVILPRKRWGLVENQSAFFEKFAIAHNIKKTEDWYKLTLDEVEEGGGSFVVWFVNISEQERDNIMGEICTKLFVQVIRIRNLKLGYFQMYQK